MRVISIK